MIAATWSRLAEVRGRRGGGALVLALLTTTVLLVLGVSFLTFLERDQRFAGYQERSEQAWYLALAGLEYSRACGLEAGTTIRRYVPAACRTHFFEVQLRADGTVLSRGVVQGTLASSVAGGTVIEKTLVAPAGAVEEASDASL